MESEVKHIRIGLVEDNYVNQRNFVQNIQHFPDLKLTILASSGEEYLDKIKGMPTNLLPAVVFMDIQMPGMNGIDTIKLAHAHSNAINYIVLTVFEDEDYIFEAIKAGAIGYLLKHANFLSIYDAITEILEYGGAPMSPAIARKALRMLNKPQADALENNEILSQLTDREREVLQNLVNGYDAKRIAEILDINTLTIRKHIANIYAKLHVNSRAQVISLAYQHKWVDKS
ncbi:MAG: response regulator transcription factor [Lentimicrobium sp.]|nr:response regulator transcription factor [Lentimicrobium sp.]